MFRGKVSKRGSTTTVLAEQPNRQIRDQLLAPDIGSILLSGQGPRLKPLCNEADNSAGNDGCGPALGQRVASEARPAGGVGKASLLLHHALLHHHLHDTTGEFISRNPELTECTPSEMPREECNHMYFLIDGAKGQP